MGLLLEQPDVSPNLSDMHGQTPLSYAAGSGCREVVCLLLQRGDVDPDLSDSYGRTPLSYAAVSGREGVVKLLLGQWNVNPDIPDMYGRTPLSYAAGSRRGGVAKLLLQRGDVNPGVPDKYGLTPLSYATESGCEGVANILLERRNFNPYSLDGSVLAPLSYIARLRREVIEEALSYPVSSPGAGAMRGVQVGLSPEQRPPSPKASYFRRHPSASVLAATPISDTAPSPVAATSSKPSNRSTTAIQQVLNPAKHKHFPSS